MKRGFARLRVWLFLATAIALWATARAARAQPASPSLGINAAPLLGADSLANDGWMSVVVSLQNPGPVAIRGTLELTAEVRWGDASPFITSAPFAVGSKSKVTVLLPTHGSTSARPSYRVRALDADGHEIASRDLPEPRVGGPVLFDLSVPSRIAAALDGRNVIVRTSSYNPTPTSVPLGVAGPEVHSATGELVLPDRPAGYAPAAAVIAPSDALLGLPERQTLALADWVAAGGALAIVVTRPEDLTSPLLKALVGGPVTVKAPPREIERAARFIVPGETAGAPSTPSAPYGRPVSRVSQPSAETVATMTGYEGGNLHDSRWGASASYGLGEVHLLAFDPLRSAAVRDDEWTKLSLVDLVRHALERRQSLAFPNAVRALDDRRVSELRRLLDPNEGSRWTVIAATLLLLAYAVAAGPWSFARAQRRGRPERALLHLPAWSAGALLAVVVLGVLGKGVRGRSRRITLIESGAGMPLASVTRFRGLYSARSDRLTVWATTPDAVLDVAGEDAETDRKLVVDREGTRIEGLQAKPWEIVVVREDGFFSMGGGVSIARGRDGKWRIANRSARDLIGVVARGDHGDLRYFRRIEDGASVALDSGKDLSGTAPSSVGPTHDLDVGAFSAVLDADVEGASAAWRAVDALAANTDWWPEDTPALVGQFDGGEGKTQDAGLRIDSDRTLVRVVGRGGLP